VLINSAMLEVTFPYLDLGNDEEIHLSKGIFFKYCSNSLPRNFLDLINFLLKLSVHRYLTAFHI
jgi:hypothetical protein